MAADLAIKEMCRVATTGNITLSGLQTIDGVSLSAGNRVLVRAQSSAIDNGLYVVASGAWSRATDFDGSGEAAGGTQVFVTSGTRFADSAWRVAGEGAISFGGSAINFEPEFLQAGTDAVPRTIQDRLRDGNSTPQDFGAVGDGASAAADQAGFEAAFADAYAPQHGVMLPPGIYDAGGLTQAGASFYLAAEIPGTVVIRIPEDEYFMTISAVPANMHVSGIRFEGGKGAFRFTNSGNNVAGFFIVQDCAFADYSECAIGNNADDHPYLKVDRCSFSGVSAGGTIGIAWGGYVDACTISDCSFLRNEYHLKIGPRISGSCHIERCDFLRLTAEITSADIWIVPSAESFGVASGEGLRVTGCKFGNENLAADENRIIVAIEDSGSGSDRLSRHHSTAWQNSAADAFVTGLLFAQNRLLGAGDTAEAAFMLSYIQELRRLVWIDNQEEAGAHTYLCEFASTETNEMGYVTRNWRIELGAARYGGIALFRRISNRNVGLISDWMGNNQGSALLTHVSGGDDVGFVELFNANTYAELLVNSSTTKSAITDALGNASRAAEVTLAGAADPELYYGSLATGLSADAQGWVELDLARGSSASVDFVTVQLYNATTGRTALLAPVTLESGWRRVRIPFVGVASSAPAAWQIRVYSPDYAASVRTRFRIGRVFIYQAREPMQAGHIRTIGDGLWNGEHLMIGGHRLAIGSDSALRYKTSAFASGTEGAPLGMKVGVPANASAAGKPGDWAANGSHIYTYTGDGSTHAWVRASAASW